VAGEIEEVGAHGVPAVEGRSRNLRVVVSCDYTGFDFGCMVAGFGHIAGGLEHSAAGLENAGAYLGRAAVDSDCTASGCCRNYVGRFEESGELAAAELAGEGEVVAWTDSLEKEEHMTVGWSSSRAVAGVEEKGWIACVVAEWREAGLPVRFASVLGPLVEE